MKTKNLLFLIPLILGLTAFFTIGERNVDRNTIPVTSDSVRSLIDEIEQLYNVQVLPEYRTNSHVDQVSSYDTTGGNNDGFSGLYSYIRKEGDNLVLADLQGPGVIHRIWTPTPTTDTLHFYFDGESVPRISIRFIDIFSGDVFPFLKPVVGNEVGGYYSYVPIPFEESCKVVFQGPRIMFHQIQYRLYPDGQSIQSYHVGWSEEERVALQKARDFWADPGITAKKLLDTADQQVVNTAISLEPGETIDIFQLGEGGRINGLEIGPAGTFEGPYKDVILQAFWDGESTPAINSPLADFFGYAYGATSMQSLLIGSRDDLNYSYFPMPFDESAVLRLTYPNREGFAQLPLSINVTVYYTLDERLPNREGKLFSVWRREINPEEGEPYLLLKTTGRGHHVGTILQAQGLEEGMTVFFEGDDSTLVDGQLRMHGTGSEDYFNGGWYALLDRWDRGISLPVHGSLDYSLPMARTGGYRLNLSDKVSFENSYLLTIEHGPQGNKVPVDYTSVALYYGDSPPDQIMEPSQPLRSVHYPETHVFYPQLFTLSVGGSAIVDYSNGRNLNISSAREGMVRFSLAEVPNGTYKLYLSFYTMPTGGAFSIWQRQRQISDWQSVFSGDEALLEKQFIGEITLTKHIDTITLRTRPEDGRNEFRIERIFLERVDA